MNTIEYTFSDAAYEGDLGKMRYLRDQRVTFDEDTFKNAAKNGNLMNISWLRRNGCDFGDTPFSDSNANLDVMRWILVHGYSFEEDTFENVIKAAFSSSDTSNQLAVLSWLNRHGCRMAMDIDIGETKMYTYSNLDHKNAILGWIEDNCVYLGDVVFMSHTYLQVIDACEDGTPYGKIPYNPESPSYMPDIDPHNQDVYGMEEDDEIYMIPSPKCKYMKIVEEMGWMGEMLIKQ